MYGLELVELCGLIKRRNKMVFKRAKIGDERRKKHFCLFPYWSPKFIVWFETITLVQTYHWHGQFSMWRTSEIEFKSKDK